MDAPKPALLLAVGAPGRGKTTAVEAAAAKLREAGWKIGGVVQQARDLGALRQGYDLVDLATGARFPFAKRRARPEPGQLGFSFDPAGWAWAAERIHAARRDADVLVVDELGRLEARALGHLPALLEVVDGERARVWLLSVRDLARGPLAGMLGAPTALVEVPAGADELQRWIEEAERVLEG